MGHEGCGAVHAAMTMTEEEVGAESEHVQLLIRRIGPAVRDIPRIRDAKARMREAVIASVRQQVYHLNQNPVVREAARGGQVAVIGAYYEISSGAVDFLETEEDLRLEPVVDPVVEEAARGRSPSSTCSSGSGWYWSTSSAAKHRADPSRLSTLQRAEPRFRPRDERAQQFGAYGGLQ
ncbi:MAG: carbonic anhydrase [Acidobacteria bacterium]|nr:carbonic anhydrase [Acidobacteriota bacterium]